jgi:flagellar protein FliJ
MSGFRLAALLRLRGLQEDAALAGLGRARHELRSAADATTAHREAVRTAGPAPSGPAAVFLAGAASRAALAVAVSDSVVLEQTAGEEVEIARSGWQNARSRSRAVARLADKYEEERRADLARRDQAESDELAAARWRGTEETDD